MYNFAQALSAGYVKLIDWKSIENANMATKEFKQQLIDSAVAAGTLTEEADGMYKVVGSKTTLNAVKNFNDSLSDQWMTTEVLTTTLAKYSDTTTEIGAAAQNAATEVTTFTKMWDALKEAAQSGWAKTWELIIGDLDHAKATLTRLNNFISGIIGAFDDARNKLLESALGKSFSGLVDNVKKSADAVKETVESVKDYVNVVDEIIAGKWGNGQSRWDKLTEAGYDWAYAQNKVNEKLGSSVRHATEFSESQEQLASTENNTTKTTTDYIVELSKLSEEELKAKGFTDEQIDSFKELSSVAEKLGMPLDELIDKSDEINGRWLLIESFANIGNSIVAIFKAIGNAWSYVFPSITSDTLFDIIAGFYKLSNIIKTYVDNNIESLTTHFRALFKILMVVANIFNGVLKIGITIVKTLLGDFSKVLSTTLDDTSWLSEIIIIIADFLNDKIASIIEKIINLIKTVNDIIVNFISNNTIIQTILSTLRKGMTELYKSFVNFTSGNTKFQQVLTSFKNKIIEILTPIKDWIKNSETIQKITTNVQKVINNLTQGIKDWINTNVNLTDSFTKIKSKIDEAITGVTNWFKTFSGEDGIGQQIIKGIIEGIKKGASNIYGAIKNVVSIIIDTFCNLLGIHSPSKVFFEYGKYIIQGLINGIKSIFPSFQKIIENIFGSLDKVNWSNISTLLLALSSLVPGLKMLDIPRQFANLFNIAGVQSIRGLIEGLKGEQFTKLIDNIKNIANTIITKFKEVLKIQSPSKVFIALGGFIMAGLLVGLKNGFNNIPDTLKGFGEKIINIFKNMSLGKVIAIGFAGAALIIVKDLIKMLNNLAGVATGVISPLKALGNAFTSIGNGIGDYFKKLGAAKNKEANANLIKNIGILIALIAASIYIISKVDETALWRSVAIVAGITIVVAALVGFITYMNSKLPKNNSFVQVNASIGQLISIAGAILLLAIAIYAISKLEINGNVIKILGTLGAVLATFIILMGVSSIAGESASKAGSMLLKISIAILILVKVVKAINELTEAELYKAGAVLGACFIVIVFFIKMSSLSGEYSSKVGTMLLKIAVSMILMIKVVRKINELTTEEINKASGVMVGFTSIFAALIAVSGLAGKASGVGVLLLSAVASMYLLVYVIKAINGISENEVDYAINIISKMGGIFAALLLASLFAKNGAQAAAIMVSFSLSLYIIIGAIALINTLSESEVKFAGSVIGQIGIIFSALMYTSKYAGKSMGSIIALSVAIGVITGALALLTLLDQDKLKSSAIALGGIILALSVSFVAMQKLPDMSKSLAGILSMTAMVIAIGVILKVLDGIDSVGALLNATAISEILLIMAVVMAILSNLNNVSLKAIGEMAILGLIVAEIAIILGVLAKLDAQPSIESATAISILLISMSATLGILALVGTLGPAALVGIGELEALLLALTTTFGVLGALVSKFPILEDFINIGGDLFAKLGSFIGEFIGNIISGIGSSVLGLIEQLGTSLSKFSENISPFLTTIKLVDSDVVTSMKNLVETLGLLSLVKFTGSTDYSYVAEEFRNFGSAIKAFLESISDISNDDLDRVKIASESIKMLAETSNNIPNSGGLLSKILGDNDINSFGTGLTELGKGLANFLDSLTSSGFDTGSSDKIKAACDCIKAIAEANDAIPNSGGLLSKIVGDNDLTDFGDDITALGKGLVNFIGSLSELPGDSSTKVQAACDCIKAIAEANDAIPNSGGLLSKIVGDNDLSDFAEDIKNLGSGLNEFLKSLTEEGSAFNVENSPKVVESACNCIKALAGLGTYIADDSWYDAFVGDSNLKKFADQLPYLGTGLNGFATNLGAISAEQVTYVANACDILTKLGDLGDLGIDVLGANLDNFGIYLMRMGINIDTFVTTLTNIGLDNINESINKVKEFIEMATTITGLEFETLSTFSTSLIEVANNGVNGFVAAFTDKVPLELAKQAAVDFLKSFIKGAESKKMDLNNEFISLCNSVMDTVNSFVEAMTKAGKDYVHGFAEGIKAQSFEAIDAAADLGRRAVEALKAAIDSNSPSKETMKVGNYFGEGFNIGIEDLNKDVYNSAYGMGETATSGLTSAMSMLSDALSNDLDVQPTITPVLDLSNVESGFAYLGAMFGGQSIGLNENLNSISSGFNSRLQNGGTYDLLNAINKLDTDLQNSNGNTLNIYTQELDSEKLDQIVDHVNRKFGIIY